MGLAIIERPCHFTATLDSVEQGNRESEEIRSGGAANLGRPNSLTIAIAETPPTRHQSDVEPRIACSPIKEAQTARAHSGDTLRASVESKETSDNGVEATV